LINAAREPLLPAIEGYPQDEQDIATYGRKPEQCDELFAYHGFTI